jgi:uncharacterized DUF497 family protein
MSPKFTKHGEQRARERGITPEEIDAILHSPETFALPSKSDDKATVAYGADSNGKIWATVFNLETGAVITVRPADKKERRLYEQKNA